MITNIRNRTMNLIYCYTIIIFMVIVNVYPKQPSESFENYRRITMLRFYDNLRSINNNVKDYFNYFTEPHEDQKFRQVDTTLLYIRCSVEQKILEPKYYYLSMYNPYYFFYFKFGNKIDEILKMKYENLKPLLSTFNSEDEYYTDAYSKYLPKNPELFDSNKYLANIISLHKLICIILNTKDETFINKLKKKFQINAIENNSTDTDYPKFYKINTKEFNLIQTLKKFLPKSKNSYSSYLNIHNRTVQALLYLNKNISSYLEKNIVQPMPRNRVDSLTSPYLLRRESYNFYVLRMENNNVLPFHIDFFKNKFNLFKDQVQKTIFEELEVNFRNMQKSESYQIEEDKKFNDV